MIDSASAIRNQSSSVQWVNEPIDVTVRLVASLRDALGVETVAVHVASGTPVGAIWSALPAVVSQTRPPTGLRYAVNDEWADDATPLESGDRVLLVLPVSGG